MTTEKGIGRRALSGLAWTLFGAIASNLARLIAVALLGRALRAEDFGVVAVAMTVVLFAARFRELGIGLALVQRKELTDDHISTTFAFSLVLGLAIAVVMLAVAGPVAAAYRMPRAEDPLRVLALLFVVRGISSTSRFMLHRELRFRAVALIELVAYLAGSGTSVALALMGHGLWALVIGYVVEASVECALLLAASPLSVRPRIRRAALRDLLGFGGGQTVAGFANYFANQGDYMVVGRVFGEVMLGLYSRAYELMRFPSQIFNTVAGSVLFSSFSRLQDDPPRLALIYRRVLFANAVVLIPASAGLIVLAPEAIRILLGSGWHDVVLPFQIMAVSMVFRTSYKASSTVARSAGDVYRIATWQIVYAFAVIGGALVSVRWGIMGVAVTTSIAVALHFLALTQLALRQVPLGWSGVLVAHLDGLALAALALAPSLPVAHVLRSHHVGFMTILVATVASGLVLPVAFAGWRIRSGATDWQWIVERIRLTITRKRKRRMKKQRASELAE